MAKAKLEFRSDVQDELSPELLNMFQRVKDAYNTHKKEAKALPSYAAHKAIQSNFEEAIADSFEVPEGYGLVFGYNYGKLSIAVKPLAKGKAKADKGRLSDWINSRANSGMPV